MTRYPTFAKAGKFALRALRGTARTLANIFPGLTGPVARFESAIQWLSDRSWLFQTLQDAWLEIDAMTRIELQRVHESLLENSPVVHKIRCLNLQFTVGPSGLTVTPNASRMGAARRASGNNGTSDSDDDVEAWNHSRAESWDRWWRKPELNSDISGAQTTIVWGGMLFDKGEIIVHLTQDQVKDVRGVVRAVVPKIQTIDSHRLCTPDDQRAFQGRAIIDGKEVDSRGRVIAYWVRKTDFSSLIGAPAAAGSFGKSGSAENFDRLLAENVIHKFNVLRPGQMRGIPKGASGYNIVRDNMDLHKLEMQAAKLASDIANVETNASGELDPSFNRRVAMTIQGQNGAGAPTTKSTFADYKVSLGSKNIALKSGDKLDQFMITRPSATTQDYWDLHYTLICIAYEAPKLLVMPYSLQGTVTRADLDVCANSYRFDFEIIAEVLRRVYEWQTIWAVKYDPALDGMAPEDFTAAFIRPPRAPNVDIGYSAKALETELRIGAKTMPDVYAEKQQDFRVKMVEIAEYLKFVNATAKKYGVDPGQITALAAQQAAEDPSADPTSQLDPLPSTA